MGCIYRYFWLQPTRSSKTPPLQPVTILPGTSPANSPSPLQSDFFGLRGRPLHGGGLQSEFPHLQRRFYASLTEPLAPIRQIRTREPISAWERPCSPTFRTACSGYLALSARNAINESRTEEGRGLEWRSEAFAFELRAHPYPQFHQGP